MSKIDEIRKTIFNFEGWGNTSAKLVGHVSDTLERLRPYVELGELIYKESAFGIIGSEMIIDFVALNKHHKQISNLLKQIKEQQ